MPAVLSLRALSRATLARQMLLAREAIPAVEAVERLAGLQAQLARPPYIGLFSRVRGFERASLTRAVLDRTLVRATLMRGTLHLVSARDYRRVRTTFGPMLERGMRGVLRQRADSLDVPALTREARAFFAAPHTFDELRAHLLARHPGGDDRAFGYAVRCALPLVQVPDEQSAWGYHGRAAFTAADAWLGGPVDAAPDDAFVVRRYLAAFGPASVADAQSWSGLQGLKETFETLRAELVTFADERGRELFDLPDAPRPPEETPAPARFLPEYDNLLLGHDDRRRVIADEHRAVISTANLQILATFLLDGLVAGRWKTTRQKGAAVLELVPFGKLAKKAKDELAAEGRALLDFTEPDARTFDVRFG